MVAPRPQSKRRRLPPASTNVLAPNWSKLTGGPTPVPSNVTLSPAELVPWAPDAACLGVACPPAHRVPVWARSRARQPATPVTDKLLLIDQALVLSRDVARSRPHSITGYARGG